MALTLAPTPRPYACKAAILLAILAAANGVGFTTRNNPVPFVVVGPSRWSRHQVPILTDAQYILFRGGDIDQDSNDDNDEEFEEIDETKSPFELDHHEMDNISETNQKDPVEDKPYQDLTNDNDENTREKISPDSAWDEEIKRLQLYLNSPESRRSSSGARDVVQQPVGESSYAYGAGEDILILGRTFRKDDDVVDERNEDPLNIETSMSISTEQSIQDDNVTSKRDEFVLNEAQKIGSDKQLDSDITGIETKDYRDDNDDVVTEKSDSEACDGEVPDAEVLDTNNDRVLEEEIIPDVMETEITPTDDDTIEEVVDIDESESSQRQIIPDNHSNAPLLAVDSDIEDVIDTTISAQRWESPPTIAESNKLVEEGLNKLRRKDGDHPSVPYVITRAMKRVLVEELGYDEDEIKAMRPDVAVVIVSESLKRPSITTLPSRFYHEDSIEPVTQIESYRDVLQTRIRSVVQKVDLRKSLIMIGSALLSYSVFVMSKCTEDEQKRCEDDHESRLDDTNIDDMEVKELVDQAVEPKDKVMSKTDLDRTWLDKLISMLTFYK
jgi:hypothetical protein